jgi:hypothetical protein
MFRVQSLGREKTSTFLDIRDRRRYVPWVFEDKKRFGLSVLNNTLR